VERAERGVRMIELPHHRIEGERFVEESTHFDEFSALKQIWVARLSQAPADTV
jgi:hypothetical protein